MRQRGDHRGLRWLLTAKSLIVTSVTIAVMTIAADAVVAAELAIPSRKPPADFSMQKGPPNCARWTDECVNCARGATAGDAPVCSNIGVACQPKAIRCLTPAASQSK
jgi:hypothetical protein